MAIETQPDGSWDRVASELRACREAQQRAWGDIDNATLGRYLANEADGEERRRVENALDELPELRRLTELVRDVLADAEPVGVPAAPVAAPPAVLPFTPRTAPRRKPAPWRRYAALAAAACVLVALGLGAPRLTGPLAPGGNTDIRSVVAMKTDGGARPAPGDAGFAAGGVDDGAGREKPMTLAVEPVALAWADGLDRFGAVCRDGGDLDRAEYSLKWAHDIRRRVQGDDNPQTVATCRNLGNLYEVALNSPAPPAESYFYAKSADKPPALPTGPFAIRRDPAEAAKQELRFRITRQNVREVRQSVVPVLAQRLRDAGDADERARACKALAELGPAAREAVPALKECLQKAATPQDRRALVFALAEISDAEPELLAELAPAAGDVAKKAAAEGDDDQKQAAQDVLLRLQSRSEPGRVGVRDAGELLSPLALKAAYHKLRGLSRDYQVEVYAETAADGKDAAKAEDKIQDRGRQVGVNGVYFLVRKSPPAVEVYVGEKLRGQGFGDEQQARLKKAVEQPLAANPPDFDRALLEGVRVVADFAKENAKAPAPKP
jgi:hypothetical protein